MAGETVRDSFNRANPNTVADELRAAKYGDVFAALPTSLRKALGLLSVYVLATVFGTSKQQKFAPAASITSAYARAGGGAPGALAVVAYPPAAGQIAIAPNGEIVTLAADAWTDLDVTYTVEKGDVIDIPVAQVVAGVLTLPTFVLNRGAVLVLECEALSGTVTGAKIVDAPGTAPAAAHAALNAAKGAVAFNAGDAVTTARLKLLVASEVDLSALLASPSTFD